MPLGLLRRKCCGRGKVCFSHRIMDQDQPQGTRDQAGEETAASRLYWRANIKLLAVLLAIWFAVSFGAGVLLREWLDQFMLGGYPLGFWFAQQGSIYVFIVLIFIYAHAMQRLERQHGLDD